MTPERFLYWLQGHFEMNGTDKALTLEQTKMVANHLNLVFQHMADAPVHCEDTMTDEQKQQAAEQPVPKSLQELLEKVQRGRHSFGPHTLIC